MALMNKSFHDHSKMALRAAEGGNTMQKYSPEKGNMSKYHHAGLDSVE
jgi:hypothetical protein